MPPDISDQLGFARSSLVRHTAEHDHGLLVRHRSDPDALTVVIAGELPVLRKTEAGATALLPNPDLDRVAVRQEQIHLGTRDGRPVLATLVGPEATDAYRDDPAFLVLDLRSIAMQGAVAADELGILATAKALLYWHTRHRHCANCGAATTLACAGFRRDCASCGAQHFPRTDPVVIMLITQGQHCLLGRQARFAPGVYSCLAGFLEPGETIEDAVRREVFEEAGVRVGPVRYLLSQPWPFPASLMIGCRGDALTADLAIDRNELEDARWFTRAEVALMLERRHPDGLLTPPPMAIAHHLVRSFAADGD